MLTAVRTSSPTSTPGPAVTLVDRDGERVAGADLRPVAGGRPRACRGDRGGGRGRAGRICQLHAEVTVRGPPSSGLAERIVAACSTRSGAGSSANLHDGAQQRLVTLAPAALADPARRSSADPEELPQQRRAPRATSPALSLEELRELARGLHPAAAGARPGRRAGRAGGSGPCAPTTVPSRTTGRGCRAGGSSAANFVALQALANVAKHAHASAVTISLRRSGAEVVVTITDDGVGGADLYVGHRPPAPHHRWKPSAGQPGEPASRGRHGGYGDAAVCLGPDPATLRPAPSAATHRPSGTPDAPGAGPERVRGRAARQSDRREHREDPRPSVARP